ncbi:Protein FAR1-RELATED SEQUENCE 5 [Abeliophyllum distichum]|uniref:Protein FAR1-RELATED SEQUENCE n=1 Tax=Abeliophyllum distichum TaxID=126358 RepID=A0ABD1TY13_9LAMI
MWIWPVTNGCVRCMIYAGRWVPAYVKHMFSAGMSSSQRSESGHSFFKRYVNRKNSLMDFITRFNMALRHQRHEELVANHIDISEKPSLMSKFQMETQMVHIYTKKIFLIFQKEIDQSHFYICTKKYTTADAKVYETVRIEHGKTFDRHRQLTYYPVTDMICCSCRTFDFDGYPCRHMISYWRKKQVLLVPDKYILRRWTKNAKASLIVDDAALTDARSTYLMGEFEALHLRAKDIDDGGTISWRQNKNVNRDDSVVILDPNPVRAKGCGKRLKSSKEKAIAKWNRQCCICGHVGHDKRTCPQVVEIFQWMQARRTRTEWGCSAVAKVGVSELSAVAKLRRMCTKIGLGLSAVANGVQSRRLGSQTEDDD